MKSKVFVILLVTSFLSMETNAAVEIPVDDSQAIEFYKNAQLVVSRSTINPFELAGCLVLQKEGEEDVYINILPESIKKTLKPQNLSSRPYRTMLTESQAIKVGFLGMLGISASQESLLEVSINDRWKLDGPSFWNDDELKESVLSIGKVYAAMGYNIKYNQSVKYSHLTTSNFTEQSEEITSAFTYVDGNGKRYVQSSDYAQKELIAISPFDITPLLAEWEPGRASPANSGISDSPITRPLVTATSASWIQ